MTHKMRTNGSQLLRCSCWIGGDSEGDELDPDCPVHGVDASEIEGATEYHVNPSLTPDQNKEAAIASLKERGLWEERPEVTDGSWEPQSQQELALKEGEK